MGKRIPAEKWNELKIGHKYTRVQLAEMWGYNGTQGLARGILSADEHVVILFTTKHKTKWDTQYEDKVENGFLIIDGQTSHMTDKAILHPDAKIYSFYREQKKIHNVSVPFIYQGRVELDLAKSIIRDKDDKPSRFCFKLPG